ncbi:MAG: hypothetical protein U0K26_01805 [Prevotella pectinovora]|uniref:hypothetical protein n=1 Tax=Prevotella pectinovora TaxID=1602169 RepID=UPI002E77119D|nr:hypothetical protein [Prevotella pectinovora]MEE1545977.1 hypothetical protein [Prevotella pectinovora]
MKRFILSMALLLTVALSTMAMSYEQARDRALFLTDKMAYELNLNDEQYEAAYEVNLDYLMSISTYDDLYGTYWTRRNMDLSYILFDWQYNAFCSAAYFYRPLIWTDGVWRFSIYARYPNRTYFYFGRPAFYATYYGGHSWHRNGGRSWYHGRTFGPRPGESRFGMRDRYDRGDFRGQRGHDRRHDNGRYDRNNRRDDNNSGRYDRNNRRDDNNSGRYDRGNNRRDNNSGYRGTTPRRGTGNGTTNLSSSRTTVSQEIGRSSRGNSFNNSPTRIYRPAGGSSRPANTFTPSRSSSSNNRSVGSGNSSSRGGGRSGGGGRFGR